MTPLEAAALRWWRSYRPYDWSEDDHVGTPTRGVRGGDEEQDLAVACAAYLIDQETVAELVADDLHRAGRCAPLCRLCLRLDDPDRSC